MRLPSVAQAYKYSLSMLIKSWCEIVQYHAQLGGRTHEDIELSLFGKNHHGRQWRRWRDSGQLTEAKEFLLVAEEAELLGWIEPDINSMFCDSYLRRYSVPPTDESESDADIMDICEAFGTFCSESERLVAAYNDLAWYAYGPSPNDPSIQVWEEIHLQVSTFINDFFVFDEIESRLLEMIEIIEDNKLFNPLKTNIESSLSKLRKICRVS